MIQVGAIIGEIHLFIARYPQVGGITTGRIAGTVMNGINKECPTNKFNATGGHGKKISIGRSRIIGEYKV